VALREGLAIIGLVGLLVAAKQKGLLASVRGVMDRLETEAGFRLNERVRQAALRAAGETPAG
jgi:predicted nucleic acid-binding protein